MLHLYLSLYSSISIGICIPPCFNLFSTSLLRQRSNFIYERALISRRADSLELIHNSIWRWHRSASVFALQDLGLCRFDLLRFYFNAISWFIRLNFFQPSRYINQSRAHHWLKQVFRSRQPKKQERVIHLRQQILILKTLLGGGRHSPRVDDLPPSNVGKLSLSKLGQLVPTQPCQRWSTYLSNQLKWFTK